MRLDKEFWKKVLEEFERSPYDFLCVASETFEAEWEENQKKIKRLARKFEKLREFEPSPIKAKTLFDKVDDIRGVRLEFLNYLIDKK